MKTLLYLLQTKHYKKGFTLIELIAASVMTLFIVAAAGFGLTVMLREQTVATADSDIQYNLGRAVDFISEEIRQASAVTTTPVWPAGQTVSCSSSGPSGTTRTFVVGLTIPPATTTNVIYFTNTPPPSPWIGQSAIYRCGPAYSGNGTATFSDCIDPVNGTQASFISSNTCPSGFEKVQKTTGPLIDLIAAPSGLTTSPCPTGFNAPSPSVTNGFFVCTNSTNNKLVEIHAFASARAYVEQRVGTLSAGSRYLDKSTYSASTQVYARSKGPVNPTSIGTNSATFTQTSEGSFSTTGCATGSLPITITGTTSTTITSNGNITAVLSPPTLDLTPASGADFTAAVGAASNIVTFTSGACVVNVSLNTL